MTVGEAVSSAGLVLDAPAAAAPDEEEEDSSMESDAIAPGAGVNEAGIPLGGCCFFLIMSL